jgi:hypothetical protein
MERCSDLFTLRIVVKDKDKSILLKGFIEVYMIIVHLQLIQFNSKPLELITSLTTKVHGIDKQYDYL